MSFIALQGNQGKMWDNSISSRALPFKMVLFWKTIIKVHTVEPKQNGINGIQEFNCDIWITFSFVGGLTGGSPARHRGVLRVKLCCPNPSQAGCGLAQAGSVLHPTEILIVILLASAAGWDFQDSGSNSRNLPLSWLLFCWPGVGRLDGEKTGHKGANIVGDHVPSLPLFLLYSPSHRVRSPFGTCAEDRSQSLMALYFYYAHLYNRHRNFQHCESN